MKCPVVVFQVIQSLDPRDDLQNRYLNPLITTPLPWIASHPTNHLSIVLKSLRPTRPTDDNRSTKNNGTNDCQDVKRMRGSSVNQQLFVSPIVLGISLSFFFSIDRSMKQVIVDPVIHLSPSLSLMTSVPLRPIPIPLFFRLTFDHT